MSSYVCFFSLLLATSWPKLRFAILSVCLKRSRSVSLVNNSKIQPSSYDETYIHVLILASNVS